MNKWLLLITLNFGSLIGAPIDVPPDIGGAGCSKSFPKDHPGQYPFPTELTFKALADHEVSCNTGKFDPNKVKAGDTVYVLDWYINWFVINIHPHIKNPYILISGDSAGLHPGPESKMILHDPKVAAWFTRNQSLSKHPKLFCIPKGQRIFQWQFTPEMQKKYLELTEVNAKIDSPLMYISYTPTNHPSRGETLSMFKDASFCYYAASLPLIEYYENLSKFKFILCPRGVGVDTVRFWEAVGLNTIPVIEHSPLDELYEGTPCVLVHDWKEITEEFLSKKYNQIRKKVEKGTLSKEKAFIDHWIKKIQTVKKLVKEGKWEGANLNHQRFSATSLKQLKKIFANSQKQECLFIFGRFTGVRPYQLSFLLKDNFERFFITDLHAFDHAEHTPLLAKFTKNELNDEKLLFTAESVYSDLVKRSSLPQAIYMDLSHYRYQFTVKLKEFLDYLPKGSKVAGNMATDPYVVLLLKDFEKEHQVKFTQIGNFWVIIK